MDMIPDEEAICQQMGMGLLIVDGERLLSSEMAMFETSVRLLCRVVKKQLKANKYLRYVDDFALFSSDRNFLTEARQAIEEYLVTLRLKLHPVKSQLFETHHGANFLGFRILPDRIRVRSENLRRGRQRLQQMQKDYAQGKIEYQDVSCSIQSWDAHLAHGDTWRLRQQIFTKLGYLSQLPNLENNTVYVKPEIIIKYLT